jgi:hypothetical protein
MYQKTQNFTLGWKRMTPQKGEVEIEVQKNL